MGKWELAVSSHLAVPQSQFAITAIALYREREREREPNSQCTEIGHLHHTKYPSLCPELERRNDGCTQTAEREKGGRGGVFV